MKFSSGREFKECGGMKMPEDKIINVPRAGKLFCKYEEGFPLPFEKIPLPFSSVCFSESRVL